MMFFASSVWAPESDLHLYLAAALQRGVAGDALHLGALEQHLDALGVLVDDAILAVLHLGIIQARVLAVDAFLFAVDEALPDVGGLEQALGGDAAHQQAGAAEPGLLFHQGGLQSVLAGANSSGVAAGTTPNHDQIVRHFFYSTRVTGSAADASTRKGPAATAPYGRGSERDRIGAATGGSDRGRRYHEEYEKVATNFDVGGGVWIRADQAGCEERGFDDAARRAGLSKACRWKATTPTARSRFWRWRG